MVGENDPSTQDPIGNVTNEDGLMELFDQLTGLTVPVLDWLELDTTIVISEASVQGKSATYQVIWHQYRGGGRKREKAPMGGPHLPRWCVCSPDGDIGPNWDGEEMWKGVSL